MWALWAGTPLTFRVLGMNWPSPLMCALMSWRFRWVSVMKAC